MHRLPALVTLFVLAAPGLAAQVLDDALVPAGLARIEVSPVFTSWDSRFGRTPSGTERERLSEDLTRDAAHTLLPGVDELRAAIDAMTGSAGFTPMFGETDARVTADVTRVELGAHLGLFDWLTVGAVVPVTRTRTSVDVWFRPDTISGNLGVNPNVTSAPSVSSFLQALSTAETATQTHATQVCLSSPGSPACASAQALADRASGFRSSAATAYSASALFPLATSATGAALAQSVATLSADMAAEGLSGIGTAMPFATQTITEADFWTLPSTPGSGLAYADALGSIKAPWHVGDMEVTATVRLLGGAADTSATGAAFTARVLATALVRLPTGWTDEPDIALDIGTGDGQTDFEGRLLAELTAGSHFGLQLGGRYGIQRPRTLVRRVAAPETVLAPASTRRLVEWEPGAYVGVEVAPVWRFTDELNLVAEYRAFRKSRDTYRTVDSALGGPLDTSVLEEESGITLHEVGGSLRYSTLGRLAAGVRPIEAHLRVMHAVAGGGGQTPVTTQVELGVRLFRRIWGG
ncbi:MAG: hypothetical protein AB7T31_14565 [Gemmatimonadales bacterium]